MLLNRDPESAAVTAPVHHFLLFAGSGRRHSGQGDVVGTFRTDAEARQAYRQLEMRHPSHNGWAELAALDHRGRLEPLSWFGPGPAAEHDGTDAEVIAMADAVRARDRRVQRQAERQTLGSRRWSRRRAGVTTGLAPVTELS